jgi:hypothetical protein
MKLNTEFRLSTQYFVMLRNEASLQVAHSSFSQRIDKARKEFGY